MVREERIGTQKGQEGSPALVQPGHRGKTSDGRQGRKWFLLMSGFFLICPYNYTTIIDGKLTALDDAWPSFFWQ